MTNFWIQKTNMKKGTLHRILGIPEDKTIPTEQLIEIRDRLQKKAKGKSKLTTQELKLLRMVLLAVKLRQFKK